MGGARGRRLERTDGETPVGEVCELGRGALEGSWDCGKKGCPSQFNRKPPEAIQEGMT